MNLLTDIENKIRQSKFHWTDIAIQIGVDKYDIFKIKEKNDPPLELVHFVTQKIWSESFHFVGLNLIDNDFTEISSIAKLGAILSGDIEKEIHQEKHVEDDISIGLRCVVSMDNIRLFNRFINLHNIDIHTYRTINNKNLLHIASEYDAVCISQILINNYKIDVNSTDKYKRTPLHLAVYYASLNITDILLKIGANVNVKNDLGETPLLTSSYREHINIVQLLLDNGADVNVKNEHGETPLLKSSYRGQTGIVKLLLDNGADVNVKDEYGDTPLKKSSYWGHQNIVQLLLDNGADVNVKNERGETPLLKSSYRGQTETVKLLLDNGADVNVKNKDGKTAIDLAEISHHHTIVELLKCYK